MSSTAAKAAGAVDMTFKAERNLESTRPSGTPGPKMCLHKRCNCSEDDPDTIGGVWPDVELILAMSGGQRLLGPLIFEGCDCLGLLP